LTSLGEKCAVVGIDAAMPVDVDTPAALGALSRAMDLQGH
jgi:hypothetical protein